MSKRRILHSVDRLATHVRHLYILIHHASPAVGGYVYILQYRRHIVNVITKPESGNGQRTRPTWACATLHATTRRIATSRHTHAHRQCSPARCRATAAHVAVGDPCTSATARRPLTERRENLSTRGPAVYGRAEPLFSDSQGVELASATRDPRSSDMFAFKRLPFKSCTTKGLHFK